MKISSTPKINNANCPPENNASSVAIRPSFGSARDYLASGVTEGFKKIEKTGFFGEFLIVDFLSMIAPRILVGLNRDRDKTGEWNFKAAAEEAGRELSSGPSMNILPMLIVSAVGLLNPASHLSRESLSEMTEHMKNVVAKNANVTEKTTLDRALAGELFDNAFKDVKLSDEYRQTSKIEFVNKLVEAPSLKKNVFRSQDFKDKQADFEKFVVEINSNSLNKVVDAPKVAGSRSATELFADFHDYSKDVIAKLTKPASQEGAVKILESTLTKGKWIKTITAATAFMAVGSFLLCLPRLYQQGDVSPAAESAKRAQQFGGKNENK